MTSGRLWKWATIAVTAALVLSSSKTAWIVMLIELFARLIPALWGGFRVMHFSRFVRGRLIVRIPSFGWRLKAVIVVAVVGAGLSTTSFRDLIRWRFSEYRTGRTSRRIRITTQLQRRRRNVRHVFRAPVRRRTEVLAGVPIIRRRSAIAGLWSTSMDERRIHWGFPVALEVLVASGIIGFISVCRIFLFQYFFGAMKLAKRYWPSEEAKWVNAFGSLAMIFEWVVLLRPTRT